MRRTGEIDPVTVQALVDGLGFQMFTEEGDYAAFATRYLMRERKGTRGQVFYERYRALGGDPNYIWGQTHLSRIVLGHLPPVPDQRDNILDSDDEDPEGERGILAAAEGGDDRPEGCEGGGAVAVPEQPPQTTPMEEQRAEGFLPVRQYLRGLFLMLLSLLREGEQLFLRGPGSLRTSGLIMSSLGGPLLLLPLLLVGSCLCERRPLRILRVSAPMPR
ncbi:hypothetical protein LguiA_004433 [Lonicera macranthoides]